MNAIRTSAKAVIVRAGRILLIRNVDSGGEWFCLPGGGQRLAEPLVKTLHRECFEELGCRVRVGRLLWVRDYISDHHEFARTEPQCHQVELMFECELEGDADPALGPVPDQSQLGVQWLRLDQLAECRFYPRALVPLLRRTGDEPRPAYLGDVN
jgi:8-oxo-dGTP diphosphatase